MDGAVPMAVRTEGFMLHPVHRPNVRRGVRSFVVVVVLVLTRMTSAIVLLTPHARALTSRAPILITDDAAFTTANGVTGGSGTPGLPWHT